MALIALDLDGTLLDDAGLLTTRSIDAITAVAAAGHRVVIATGRPPSMALPVTRALAGVVSHIVGGNGSVIATFPATREAEPEVLQLIGFTFHDAAHVVATLRARDPQFAFALATDTGFAHEPGFAELMPAAVPGDTVPDVLAIGGTTTFKLFAFHPSTPVHDLISTLPAHLAAHPPAGGWNAELDVSHVGAEAVEIGPSESDKCAGVAWLCAHLGVERDDVIAIGDEWNDVTMLEWAGRGVAMGNASQRVRDVADETIGDHRDDGVARFLEAFI